MASSGSKISVLALVIPVFVPAVVSVAGYGAWKTDWRALSKALVSGPGRTLRIIALLFALLNLKNLPLAWTIRVFAAIFYHGRVRRSPALGPRALFAPIISKTRAPLLEIDYNFHKSNSTYFADLDISRTHLVGYLLRPALEKLGYNARTKLVSDPSTGLPASGAFNIVLGSVHCSFRREIPVLAAYELWSQVLAWDRKWLYIVTHFVPAGLARPTEWLDPRMGRRSTRPPADGTVEEWRTKVHASAVSKYVFKLGRLTINPALVLDASGLLPERADGWTGGDRVKAAVMPDVEERKDDHLDWQTVERRRTDGLRLAQHFLALDQLQELFDGGSNGALGIFGPG